MTAGALSQGNETKKGHHLGPYACLHQLSPEDSSMVAPNLEQGEQCSFIQVSVARRNFHCPPFQSLPILYLCFPGAEALLESEGIHGVSAEVPDAVVASSLEERRVDLGTTLPRRIQLPTHLTCK